MLMERITNPKRCLNHCLFYALTYKQLLICLIEQGKWAISYPFIQGIFAGLLTIDF